MSLFPRRTRVVIRQRYAPVKEVTFPDEILADMPDEMLAQRATFRRTKQSAEVFDDLVAKRPMRVRSMRSEMKWLVKEMDKLGCDVKGELPEWLRP